MLRPMASPDCVTGSNCLLRRSELFKPILAQLSPTLSAPGILLGSNHPSTFFTKQAGQHLPLLLTHQALFQGYCNAILLQSHLRQARKRSDDLFTQTSWAEAVKEISLSQRRSSHFPLLLRIQIWD